LRLGGKTTAHKVDYLDPIVVVERSVYPLTPAHDLAIEFNCNSRGRQIELGD
jgi:hypothetical protein